MSIKIRVTKFISAVFGKRVLDVSKRVYHWIKIPRLLKKELKNNLEYKDKYKGQRCFIFGNGPSVKDLDFEAFAKEYVFACNYSPEIEGFSKVAPNFFVLYDLGFFGDNGFGNVEMERMDQNYIEIEKMNPEVFVPVTAYKFLKEKNLLDKLNIHYFRTERAVTDLKKITVDLCEALPGYETVVQEMISIAIYMGFSKIYLLGCETSMLLELLDFSQGKNIPSNYKHAYERVDKGIGFKCVSDMLIEQAGCFYGYECLGEYCEKNDIELVNCTPFSLIRNIEKGNIEDVLNS